MAFDFPSSPSVGQVFTPLTGTSYVWNGYAWVLSSVAGQYISISDTPPATPSPGALWWESDSGSLYIYYNDGNTSQWVSVPKASGPAAAAAPAGSLILLATTTASNSATIDFPGLSSQYDEYEVHFFDVLPVTTSNTLALRIGQSGVFQATASYSATMAYAVSSTNTINGQAYNGGTAINLNVGSNLSNTLSTGTLSGKIKIARPATTTSIKQVTFETAFQVAANLITCNGGGTFISNTNAIDSLRFFMATGNISQGTFKLYGVT